MIDLDQIRGWADEAISRAEKECAITLDYSRESIGLLEKALTMIRQKMADEDTWEVACRFGAYFGETMLKDFESYGYVWEEDYDGEPCLVTSKPQEGASLDKILPITKVNKYLLSGPTESPAKLYAMCLSMLKGGDMMSNLASLGVDPSQVPGVEPLYVNKGKFDANAAAWLLYGDYVFFQAHEIAWDGTTHRIVGLQVNAAKMNEIPTLVSNTNLLNGLVDLLTELEKDEGLRVPLTMVHPGLHDALRNEDLTGITLFNLMACAQALIIKEASPDDYQAMCDSRLPLGIPAFYQLVARMIWGMRAYNDRSGSYKVTFVNARNLDADVVLGKVDQMVPGAFSQPIWQVEVTDKPQVQLPSMAEAQAFAREASRVFASGFDDPMDIQADEELFVSTLNQLAREFPITQDIEGTHHMGRIPRIEHVRVGDPLVLAADWQSEFFDPACIEVFNAAGETLGNLRERFSPALSGNRELACLLPHVTATVETVTPKSKRRKNAKYALMDVRMELDPAVLGPDGNLLPDVIRDAKALLALPRGERVVVSKGGIVASQLSGNIRVDEAHDVPNPLGETFRLWDVESDDMPAVEPVPELETSQTVPELREVPQQTFDTGRWTFDRHQLVQARRFCIEVPDQWEPGGDDSGRVLGSYVQGVEDDSEYPQILCNSMIGDLDEEAQKLWRETGIPEVHLQMQRKAIYSNDMTNKIMRSVNDWVVPGKNCKVLVLEHRNPSLFPDMFPDSYEYHVKPLAYDHEDFMRLADPYEHLGDGELKALAFAVAATVELDAPVELRRPAELERYCEGPADADAFCETVTVIANMLNMSGSDRMTANLYQAVRRADNDMQVLLMGDTMPLIQAEAFNESLHDEVHYFGRIVQALEKQAELGTDGFERMWKLAGEFGEGRVVDHVTMSDNKEDESKINALGVIKIPEEYAALHDRWEALKPGQDGKPGKPLGAAVAVSAAAATGQSVADRHEMVQSVEGGESPEPTRQQKSADFADRILAERREAEARKQVEARRQAEARKQAEEAKRKAREQAQTQAEPTASTPASSRLQRSADFADRILAERREAAARGSASAYQQRSDNSASGSRAESRGAEPRKEAEARVELTPSRREAVQRQVDKERREASAQARAEAASTRPTSSRQQKSADFADRILAERREAAAQGQADEAALTWYEKIQPSGTKGSGTETERIARENAERARKLDELRESWRGDSAGAGSRSKSKKGAKSSGQRGARSTAADKWADATKPPSKTAPAGGKSGGKTWLALIVLVALAIAAWLYASSVSANEKKEAYARATELMESGEYTEAAFEFFSLDDYEDSATLANEARAQARAQTFKGVKTGDRLKLGSYEQDGKIENGPEPIQWIVLDVEDDKALLLSRYGLDSHTYNDQKSTSNSWRNSSLRAWLAGSFCNDAFSPAEQHVFLAEAPLCLDVTQANQYLLSKNRVTNEVACTITTYAARSNPMRSIGGDPFYNPGDAGSWWLRQDTSSNGEKAERAPIILYNGALVLPAASGGERYLAEVTRCEIVRPAIYVYLN